ncbi:alpha/beta fold hydrolase [Thermogutta sp.]|uniref:alpha/beta fold hydrolase n=1 Tax=Thermogutta sp. TaxID=1962930 RepID=UPI003C7A324C
MVQREKIITPASPGRVELAFEDTGSGLPVLLIHGFPLDRTMWKAQWEGLSNEFRVIVPDLRGFGESQVIPGVATMEMMADDLAGLCDHLGLTGKIVLGGLSMGGYVAFAFARKYRDRLAGLILCDTRARPDTPEAKENRRRVAERVRREGPGFIADEMIPRLCCEATFRNHPEVIDAIRQMMLSAPPEGVAAAALGMAERPDSTDLLATLSCPTLVLVGEFDAISPPEEMQAMAQAIPQSQLVVIPDAGHLAPMEQPDRVTQAIREWLRSVTV